MVAILAAASGCAHCNPSSDDVAANDDGVQAGRCGDPYPEQRHTPYILPWRAGLSFTVGQGNCTDGSHEVGSSDAFAYDIDMPIGTELIAVRAGSVLSVEERFVDGNRTPGEENYVNILHEDGTVSVFYHLTRDGALVTVGERVSQGQLIGRSGDTGDSTEPHVHFQVDACQDCGSRPVTFRNTRAHPGGLVEGETYRAETP